jgi:hypothetical protein
MANTTKIVNFFKSKVPAFMKTFGYKSKLEEGETALINGFIDHVADEIAYSAIVTKKEIAETLVLKGIDREFVNKHIDTLLKIEAVNLADITMVTQRKFLLDCTDLMERWFEQSKSNPSPFYAEIKHDYFDDYNQCWVIDAWRTPDDDEDGVAPIEVYLDGSLKIRDEIAFGFAICELNIIEAIEEVLNEIQSENKG